ncbi:MAG: N-acetyltransferase family protein [Acetanaerobacterium sp.]
MNITLREYMQADIVQITGIWNAVVRAADAFPQTEPMTEEQARAFFAEQSYTGVVANESEVLGMYILHPNNIGRCGHIANASFAVKSGCTGRGIGELLVRDCIRMSAFLGFKILQFNAVVATNTAAIHLYEKLGFQRLGRVPNGFLLADGEYADIILFYISLDEEDISG